MNLINFKYREDFGSEWYVQVLNTGKHVPKFMKNYSLFQGSVSWNDFPGWPYVQITFGSNGLFGVLLWVYKFGLDIDILSRTWRWDHTKELDEKEVKDYVQPADPWNS
jgi:hypothetical protein